MPLPSRQVEVQSPDLLARVLKSHLCLQDQSALLFHKRLFAHRMTSQFQDTCKLGCHIQELSLPEVKIWTVNSMGPAMALLPHLSCSTPLQKATQQLSSPSHRSQGQTLVNRRSQGQSHQGSEAPKLMRSQQLSLLSEFDQIWIFQPVMPLSL